MMIDDPSYLGLYNLTAEEKTEQKEKFWFTMILSLLELAAEGRQFHYTLRLLSQFFKILYYSSNFW